MRQNKDRGQGKMAGDGRRTRSRRGVNVELQIMLVAAKGRSMLWLWRVV